MSKSDESDDDTANDTYGSDSDLDEDLLPEDKFERLLTDQVHSQEYRSICASKLRAAVTEASRRALDNALPEPEPGSNVHELPAGADTVVAPAAAQSYVAPQDRCTPRKLSKLIDTTRILIAKLERHDQLSRQGRCKLVNLQRKLSRLESEAGKPPSAECKE